VGVGRRRLAAVLVVTRYRVPSGEATDFAALAEAALDALTARAGCTGGRVGRAADDPGLWTLTTTWACVGDYRRALSAYDVKVRAVPLMYRAVDEPTAYEDLLTWSPDGGTVRHPPARADDADTAAPGRPPPVG
jgi:hypothetical protein